MNAFSIWFFYIGSVVSFLLFLTRTAWACSTSGFTHLISSVFYLTGSIIFVVTAWRMLSQYRQRKEKPRTRQLLALAFSLGLFLTPLVQQKFLAPVPAVVQCQEGEHKVCGVCVRMPDIAAPRIQK
jgi:uncharacterized membrane protein